MTGNGFPQSDSRSVDELFNVALTGGDEEAAWNAIAALHWRATREVLHRAATLCGSPCPYERQAGADILGQLGVPEQKFPRECAAVLIEMLESEADADVLYSIFIAFGHLHDPVVLAMAPRFARHADADVRYAVVHALTGHEDEVAVDLLIELTTDLDSDVRDWATFGLGTQLDLDTAKIRNALVPRLQDSDDDTRGEAMIGLARRNDARAIQAILHELGSNATDMAVEAAELVRSPELLPALLSLRDAPELSAACLDRAIKVCSRE